MNAEIDGDRLTDEEVVATGIVTMVGGQETTTNLIGNGVLTLLRHPEAPPAPRRPLAGPVRGRGDAALRESRASTPAGWPRPTESSGASSSGQGQAVMAIMAAANRDPERFPDPDRLRYSGASDNRHLAFGYAAHFCFGAPWPGSRARRRSTLSWTVAGPAAHRRATCYGGPTPASEA